MKHRAIPKRIREQVYAKYSGHCAYCGCELEYKDMQVDHIESLWRKSAYRSENGYIRHIDDPSVTQDDSIDNLMPSCRQCNFYKSDLNIEEFRTILKETFEKKSLDTWQIRFGIKYGMITRHEWDGQFYFENENDKVLGRNQSSR